MIELRTGIPGSGKTLSLVQALARLLESWNKNPELGRPVFVHNIKDLALSHAVMPTKDSQVGNVVRSVPDWDSMPDGSLVIIDECQDMIPPRSTQSTPPAHIAWFNTHRHKGFDIWLATQHPKLIDGSVRALVGKHVHFRRLFGGQRAATYEWDGCSDNLGGMKDAVMSLYNFPKKAFQWYKSAEIHTKQSFKLPRWLLIPVAGLALGAFMIPNAYKTLSGAIGGKGISQAALKSPEQGKPLAGALAPSDTAQTAQRPPLVPLVNPVAETKIVVAGCIVSSKKECECFDTKGNTVDDTLDQCVKFDNPQAVLTAKDLPESTPVPVSVFNPADASVLAYMHPKARR